MNNYILYLMTPSLLTTERECEEHPCGIVHSHIQGSEEIVQYVTLICFFIFFIFECDKVSRH